MNNNMNKRPQYDDEIDLLELARKIIQKWYFVLVGLLLGAALGFVYSAFIITPLYSSTAEVYLRGDNKLISLESINLSSKLTADYEVIFKSRPNVSAVIDDLNLDMSVKELQEKVEIINVTDTRILQIKATATSPELARDIANGLMEKGMDSVREIDSQEPYIVEKAIANPNRVNGSIVSFTAKGGIFGAVIVAGIITFLFVMNDNIMTREDIENYVGIPVLTTVLEDDAFKKEFDKNRKRKRSK